MVVAGVGLFASAGACGDDDTTPAVDGGPDVRVVPPIPIAPDSAIPPEGIDATGRLGSPVLVADVQRSVDGPSWRVADQALYFTVPNEAPTLRRLRADGGVEAVAHDAGPPGPYGTANGGGASLFVTEPSAITSVNLDADGGPATIVRKSATFELLGDIAAQQRPDASTLAFFVDTGGPRAYRFDPSTAELVRVLDRDGGGRASGIAVGRNDVDHRVVYVAVGTGSTGSVVVLEDEDAGDGLQQPEQNIPLPGTSPNGIAVDDQGFMYVAWAEGIDVYERASAGGGSRVGPSPGLRFYAPPTSLTFGGADRRTLFVTTATGKIYAVPASVPGVLR